MTERLNSHLFVSVLVGAMLVAIPHAEDLYEIGVSIKNEGDKPVDVFTETQWSSFESVNDGRGIGIAGWPIADLYPGASLDFDGWLPDVDRSTLTIVVTESVNTTPEMSYTASQLISQPGVLGVAVCRVSGRLWSTLVCVAEYGNIQVDQYDKNDAHYLDITIPKDQSFSAYNYSLDGSL